MRGKGGGKECVYGVGERGRGGEEGCGEEGCGEEEEGDKCGVMGGEGVKEYILL